MKHETLDAAIAASASKATYTGAGMSVTGWLLSSEAAVLFGLILGIAGLLVNIYFKRREDQRQEREHQARMAELRK
jgi:hypothetical protein